MSEEDAGRPNDAIPLQTVFVTGVGGQVYELPEHIADQYLITPERLHQIGHLPIVPYGTTPSDEEPDDEVGGRHMTLLPSGVMGFHADVQYGAFVWTDGHTYLGHHFHPNGTEIGHFA